MTKYSWKWLLIQPAYLKRYVCQSLTESDTLNQQAISQWLRILADTTFPSKMTYRLFKDNPLQHRLTSSNTVTNMRQVVRALNEFLKNKKIRFNNPTKPSQRPFLIFYKLHEKWQNILDFVVAIENPLPALTWEQLLERSDLWHHEILQKQLEKDAHTYWDCPIQPFTEVVGENTFYIHGLTSYRQLHTEGRDMNHCVLSYMADCVLGNTQIFSIVHKNSQGEILERSTVELVAKNNRRWEVGQVRGINNALSSKDMCQIAKVIEQKSNNSLLLNEG